MNNFKKTVALLSAAIVMMTAAVSCGSSSSSSSSQATTAATTTAEATTEATTQATTEATTEKTTEKTTEATTEASTDEAAENPLTEIVNGKIYLGVSSDDVPVPMAMAFEGNKVALIGLVDGKIEKYDGEWTADEATLTTVVNGDTETDQYVYDEATDSFIFTSENGKVTEFNVFEGDPSTIGEALAAYEPGAEGGSEAGAEEGSEAGAEEGGEAGAEEGSEAGAEEGGEEAALEQAE